MAAKHEHGADQEPGENLLLNFALSFLLQSPQYMDTFSHRHIGLFWRQSK